jgi:hypothetical protein
MSDRQPQSRSDEWRDIARFMAESGRPDLALQALQVAEREAEREVLQRFFGVPNAG